MLSSSKFRVLVLEGSACSKVTQKYFCEWLHIMMVRFSFIQWIYNFLFTSIFLFFSLKISATQKDEMTKKVEGVKVWGVPKKHGMHFKRKKVLHNTMNKKSLLAWKWMTLDLKHLLTKSLGVDRWSVRSNTTTIWNYCLNIYKYTLPNIHCLLFFLKMIFIGLHSKIHLW